MEIELLYFDGCPNHEKAEARLKELMKELGIQAPIRRIRVEDEASAVNRRFIGSPTIRINGKDVDPNASRDTQYGLKCRIFRTPKGFQGVPPDEWIRSALLQAKE